MHNARVSYDDLAAELGLTKGYLSMILNGKRNPPGARKRLEDAVKAVIERRKEENDAGRYPGNVKAHNPRKRGGAGARL